MNKRPLLYLVFISVVTIFSVVLWNWWTIILFMMALITLCFLWKKKEKKRNNKWCFAIILVMIASIIRGQGYQIEQKNLDKLRSINKTIEVSGRISKKESTKEINRYYLKNSKYYLQGNAYPCGNILVYLDADSIFVGETIYLTGKIKPFAVAKNQGEFDESTYYKSLQISTLFQAEKVLGISGKKNQLQEKIERLRTQIRSFLIEQIEGKYAGVLLAMLIADKSLLEEEVKMIYQKAGISHILAISGLHIGILCLFFYRQVKKITSYWISFVLTLVWLFLFLQLTGELLSAKRAGFMFVLFLYSQLRGRKYDLVSSLSLIAWGFIWGNPGLMLNAGFLLSIAAVSGIGLATEVKDLSKFSTIRTLVYIQLFTIPILAWFYYELSVYGILANILLLPLAGVILACGMIGCTVGMLFPITASICLLPATFVLSFIESVATIIVNLPKSTYIIGKPSIFWLFIWYGLVLLYGSTSLRRKKQNTINLQKTEGWTKKIASNVFFSLSFFFMLCIPIPLLHNPEIILLDVGQGDGIFIRTSDGTNLFIDGGSSSTKQLGKYTILPFLKAKGIKEIDYWFLSHADADHVNGFYQVLESGFKINTVVFSTHMVKDEAYETLLFEIKRFSCNSIKMDIGSKIISPKNNGFAMTCLAPEKTFKEDRNARSLVLWFEQKDFFALFAGDISIQEEEWIANMYNLPTVDYFKGIHHGSDGSNASLLLEEITPKLSVISVGDRNSYGHPGKEAMKRLESYSTQVAATQGNGQLSYCLKQKQLIMK